MTMPLLVTSSGSGGDDHRAGSESGDRLQGESTDVNVWLGFFRYHRFSWSGYSCRLLRPVWIETKVEEDKMKWRELVETLDCEIRLLIVELAREVLERSMFARLMSLRVSLCSMTCPWWWRGGKIPEGRRVFWRQLMRPTRVAGGMTIPAGFRVEEIGDAI
jgi:hypothetical protein